MKAHSFVLDQTVSVVIYSNYGYSKITASFAVETTDCEGVSIDPFRMFTNYFGTNINVSVEINRRIFGSQLYYYELAKPFPAKVKYILKSQT